MLTEKDYCDYDTCVALKELGYKGISRFFYATKESPLRRYSYDQILTTRIADAVGHTLAISLYYAQKWLREEKGIYVMIEAPWKTDDGLGWSHICCNKPLTIEDQEVCFATGGFFDSYEEALLEGIKEAVKILMEE